MKYNFKIEEKDAKKRLDVFLANNTDLTRSQIKNLISEGCVLLGGKKVKAGFVLKTDDEILLDYQEFKPLDLKAEDIEIDVVYENNDFAVINKAQGMVVHPAAGNWDGTLVNALLFHFKSLSHSKDVRPGIVHRLDKNTSGLMVVAKNNKAHAVLAQQIKEKVAKRKYLALLTGNLKEDEGTIQTGIGRHPKDRKKMAVFPEGEQKLAITHYKVVERYVGFCLVEFELKTGRTHQIRVHCRHLGHPIVGDEVYGGNTKLYSKGQLLHSYKLEFFDLNGKINAFETKVPEYFEKVLLRMKRSY